MEDCYRGGSDGIATVSEGSTWTGVDPNVFLHCSCPLNGVGDGASGITPDALSEWSAGRRHWEGKSTTELVVPSSGSQNRKGTQALGVVGQSHRDHPVKLWGWCRDSWQGRRVTHTLTPSQGIWTSVVLLILLILKFWFDLILHWWIQFLFKKSWY